MLGPFHYRFRIQAVGHEGNFSSVQRLTAVSEIKSSIYNTTVEDSNLFCNCRLLHGICKVCNRSTPSLQEPRPILIDYLDNVAGWRCNHPRPYFPNTFVHQLNCVLDIHVLLIVYLSSRDKMKYAPAKIRHMSFLCSILNIKEEDTY